MYCYCNKNGQANHVYTSLAFFILISIIKLPVKILSDDSNIDKVYFNNDYHDLVKRMNIEFSDIYIGND